MEAPFQIDPKLVIEKSDILKVLQYLGITDYRIKKDELYIKCLNPDHEDTRPSLSINIGRYKGIFNCWSCQFNGDLPYLVSFVKKVSYDKAVSILADLAGIQTKNLDENQILDLALTTKRNLQKIIPKVETKALLHEIDLPRNCVSAKGHPALEAYKIPDKYADLLGIKFCTKGYYENRLIFPIYFEAKLVSFLARWNGKLPEGVDKALYPKDAPTGRIVYNYDRVKSSEIVLVEGIKDSIRVEDAGYSSIACFGNKITDDQVPLLSKYKKITILPDRNNSKINTDKDPGAILISTVVSKLSHKVDIWIGFIPDGKDPGDSTIDEITMAINRSKKYRDHFSIRQEEKPIIVSSVVNPIKKRDLQKK